MASVIIPPGFCQVVCSGRVGATGHVWQNVFGASTLSPLDQTSVNARSTAFANAYKAFLTTGSTYDKVRILEGQDGPPIVWESVTGAGAGTRATGTFQTPQVQFLCRKGTQLSGRKFTGRSFLPDVKESDAADDGTVAAGTVTALQTWATAMHAALESGDLVLHVLLHSDVTDPTIVTSFTAQSKVATLRRRYTR